MYYILKGEFMGLKLEAYKATELFFENKLEGVIKIAITGGR